MTYPYTESLYSKADRMSEVLLAEIDGAVARITFNRPEVRNAANSDMITAMRGFLEEIARDDTVRCIVISGAGEHFMAGGDVAGFGETLMKPGEVRQREFLERIQRGRFLFIALAKVPQPVVASVRGVAAGAGLGFVAGADFALCGDNSVFVLSHVRIGACPDGSTTYYLPRILGVRKAKELAILGDRLSAADALQYGLVNQVVADSELDAATDKLVQRIVDAPRQSVQSAKRSLNMSLGHTLEEQLQLEAETFSECAATDDFAEGVSAFLEKRKAVFNRKG